jgi:alcohol dehydrogenase class IV
MPPGDAPVTFSFPNRILFGDGARNQLANELDRLGIERPLVVSDPGVVALASVEALIRSLRAATVFVGVQPNPTEDDCLAGLEVYRKRGRDGVVSIGGGSAIDAGKAIRLLATHPGTLADYDVNAGGMSRITANLPSMVAVPTTAGTGSEAGRGTLIQLPSTGRKTAIISPYMLPSLSVCDPELTYAMPPELTAATGMDALTHAVESYLSPAFHPICDGIAAEALRHMARGLEAAVIDGSDRTARHAMMVAALLAGISFHKGLGATHALSHALGSRGRVHHGTLNAILLPHVLRFNRPACESRLADLALLLGLNRTTDAAGHFVTLVDLLLARLPLPKKLGEIEGLQREEIPRFADLAQKDHCLKTNPRPASHTDLVELLEAAW